MREDASACHQHALTVVSMSVDVCSGQQGPVCASRRHLAVASTASWRYGDLSTRLTQTQAASMTVWHMYVAIMSLRCMRMTLDGMGSRFRPSCTRVLAAVVAMT